GTVTGTISAGQSQATVNGVAYTRAESGVKLAATRTSGDVLLAAVSSAFTVDPGAASKFVVTGSGTQTAGNPNQLTVTAEDPNGNLATAYNGDHGVTFSGAGTVGGNNPSVTDKSGSAVAFGSSTTLTFTNGVATAGGSLVLVKAEGATIVATAGAITTTGADRLGVTVSPSSTTGLGVSTTAGSPQTAGAAFDVTVTARDQFGN